MFQEGFDIVARRPPPTPWECPHGHRLTDRPLGRLEGLGKSSCCEAGATYVVAERIAHCKCCLRSLQVLDKHVEDALVAVNARHAE